MWNHQHAVYMKTKILGDFQICIRVPLSSKDKKTMFLFDSPLGGIFGFACPVFACPCTDQLLTITCEVYKTFDEWFNVGSVFLDMLEVFDKVWRNLIIFKPKQNDISSNPLNLFT